MTNRTNYIFILFPFVLFFFSSAVTAQKKDTEDKVTFESVIKDQQGKPIKGAIIYGDEGSVVAKTSATGRFTIPVSGQSDLLIEAEGYEPVRYKSAEYKDLKEFSLKPSPFLHSENDVVNIAFGKIKKGDIVNAVSVLDPAAIMKYDNIQTVAEVLLGRVPGLLGSFNIRGIGGPLFVVDGLPRDINNINLAEVAQVTVLKDINSAILYGNQAVNGVVLITTKRGEAFKKQVKVSGFYGMSTPTALPEYLPSAGYMELYNEARLNDGLAVQYDQATIDNFRSGNPFHYPNIDYYSKEYLRKSKPFSRIMTELSGGNEVATYYTNIGWDQTGSLLNFGAGKGAKLNRFNVRGNVDLKVNSWIKSSLDAVAVLTNNKGALGDYWADAATKQPNLFAPFIPISLIDPANGLLKANKNEVNGLYLLGGASNYLTNAFANSYSGGVTESIQRTFSFNNRIDFDLKKITAGLAFHTNVSFDMNNSYDQSINNSYSVYAPAWNAAGDSIISLTKYGNDTRSGTQNIKNSSYKRRVGFYGMLDYDKTFGEIHHVSASLLGYGNRYKTEGDLQGGKDLNLGLRLLYGYKNKYLADFSSAFVNSVKLPEGNRGAFSPSLGLSWVMSSEKFMESISAIDYLKFRVSGGIMNTDAGIGGFYYYDNVYGRSGTFSWNEGTWSNGGTVSGYGGNNQLGFEKRTEFNAGFESVLFNHHLSLDANVFTSKYADLITRPQTLFPGFYSNFIPYKNFERNSYRGAELGLAYNLVAGDFSFSIGGNALYATSKVVIKDEIYNDPYQYRAGQPIDARFGLVADGLFMDQADISSHPVQSFGKVVPGDIKYVDQNNDGVIDANDEVQVGRSQAPFSYGVNLKLAWKGLSFFVIGNGRKGAEGYLSNNYYWVDGTDKYSAYILNRWTEATKTTATLPRLSSLANPNNYRSSTFWLYNNNYFTIDRVQLTYEMPDNITRRLKMKQLCLLVNASNLLTVSKNKDIRELSIGSEPYYRSFSLGIKTMF